MSLVSELLGLITSIGTEMKLKAYLLSPTFTGDPKSVTPAAGDNDTSVATTAFVQGEKRMVINPQVASYTLALTDANKTIELSNGAAQNVTVPPNAAVAFPVNTQLVIRQTGAGKVSCVAGAGVTLQARGLPTTWACAGQYGAIVLTKRAVDTWVLDGDLIA